MISVQEATQVIQSNLFQPATTVVALDDAIGHVLAEDVFADRDFPPFDRVAMDGIALNSEAFKQGRREFKIEGTQYAGSKQLALQDTENCLEVMTGAMLPQNVNCVIRFEDIKIEEGKASVEIDQVHEWQNVHRQASDSQKGDLLITKNTRVGAAEIGVLATVGKASVTVYSPIKIAIVSTGDELVSVNEKPQPFQIRKSNSHVLKSALKEMNQDATIFHVNDEEDALKDKLGVIVEEYDVVILSGGVSKGKKDFVPAILDELGIQKLFHRVAQKPGKPFWFGKSDSTTVFALPGNPVSTYLCFNKYIKPWLASSYDENRRSMTAILGEGITFRPTLTYFAQVKIHFLDGQLIASPVLGKGSGDLGNLLEADGFVQLPADKEEFEKGDSYKLILYRSI